MLGHAAHVLRISREIDHISKPKPLYIDTTTLLIDRMNIKHFLNNNNSDNTDIAYYS